MVAVHLGFVVGGKRFFGLQKKGGAGAAIHAPGPGQSAGPGTSSRDPGRGAQGSGQTPQPQFWVSRVPGQGGPVISFSPDLDGFLGEGKARVKESDRCYGGGRGGAQVPGNG